MTFVLTSPVTNDEKGIEPQKNRKMNQIRHIVF